MQELLIFVCIINASLLLLHEIESAFEKEWEILHLPGGITGFLLLHIPILFLLFYCPVLLAKAHPIGLILSVIIGIGGIMPFAIHKVLVKSENVFNRPISRMLIYLNLIMGLCQTALSLLGMK